MRIMSHYRDIYELIDEEWSEILSGTLDIWKFVTRPYNVYISKFIFEIKNMTKIREINNFLCMNIAQQKEI